MKELMERVLQRISGMSEEQLASRIDAAKSGEVATFIEKAREFSVWLDGRIFLAETVSPLRFDLPFFTINYNEEDVTLLICAANDERFALAA